MAEPVKGKDLWDEEYVMALSESMGGAKKIAESIREYGEICARMSSERASLMEKYPNKYVAMGKDGLLAVCDSLEELIDAAEKRMGPGDDYVIDFLDTDPPIYIL